MNRVAAFWSWLDEGRCRLCAREARAILIADLARVRTPGDATRVRTSLIHHFRAFHPEYVKAIAGGRVMTRRLVDMLPLSA